LIAGSLVKEDYQQRHLVIVHLARGDRIRIISARLAAPSEKEEI